MPLTAEKRRQIERIFEKFLQNRARNVKKIKIEDLNINPFLIRLLSTEMNLNTPKAIVTWLVHQRLERGMVTSFGIALQEAAKIFSEGTGVEGADILKTKQGRHYHIQVKSGPNTIPKDLGVRISQLLRSAQRRNRGSVALFAMCYGSKKQVSGIVRKYVEEEGGINWLSGKEFWEFISDEPDCIDEIYSIAAGVSENFQDKKGKKIFEILESKVDELYQTFLQLYGNNPEEMWKSLLKLNS